MMWNCTKRGGGEAFRPTPREKTKLQLTRQNSASSNPGKLLVGIWTQNV